MTKADLVSNLAVAITAKSGEKVSKKFAREVLDAVLWTFSSELVATGALSLSGFGHFKVSERSYTIFPGRPGEKKDKNLATKVTRKNASFRPAKALKSAVNGGAVEPVVSDLPASEE